ncbi:cadherin-like domain-containing protein [Shimia sp. SDUM112013]|uniref:Ig-like domain-containing protein n=1 Tax=Shimia sp. SDUM112013 TaxID=3136160 RepID=UPI0032EF1C61
MPEGAANQTPIAEDDLLGGANRILFVSDSGAGRGIANALRSVGYEVDGVLDNFSRGTTWRLQQDLSDYGAIFWSASGNGAGDQHTDPEMFANLTEYVTDGGRVFVTGYDSVASPRDDRLIAFLGGTGSRDFGGPRPINDVESSLTTGVVDIRGLQPQDYYGDLDTIFVDPDLGTQVIVPSSYLGGASWSLRQLGEGEIAYVSNGQSGGVNSNWRSWENSSADGTGVYNAAIRNFAASTEQGLLVSANRTATVDGADLLSNDSDPDNEPVSIIAVSATSALGAAVTLNADGTITYDPTGSATIQALDEADREEDSFTYTIDDGVGGTATATVYLRVNGVDDVPVQTGVIDVNSAYYGEDFAWQVPYDLFEDLSGGPVTYDIRMADGGALPDWLSFDNRTLGFSASDMDASREGDLALQILATETDGQNALTAFTLSIVGDETVGGTAGDDDLTGFAGADFVFGLAGNDTLAGAGRDDTVHGGDGNDSLFGDDGHDLLSGGTGDDTVAGGEGSDSVYGGDGHDSIEGGNGPDWLLGMEGNDTIEGGADHDHVGGGAGDDVLNGGLGNDTIGGSDGQDTITGDDGNLSGGRDRLYGGAGNDSIFGGASGDYLNGEDGDDTLIGGYGNDTILGGAGDDFIFGGLGRDLVTGGDGADRFFLNGALLGGDHLRIHDYSAAEGDTIVIDGSLVDTADFWVRTTNVTLVNPNEEAETYNQETALFYRGQRIVEFLNEDIDRVVLRLPVPGPEGEVVVFDLV